MRVEETLHNPHAQLSRGALVYVLLVLSSSVGLLARYLPLWISVIGIVCMVWRLLVFSGKWSFPTTWQKALLVLGCCAGIAVQNRSGISLDAFVAMLLTGLALKSLEVYHNKSAQLFLYVAVLVLMSYLLYEQGFVASVLAFLQILLVVAAMVAINSDHQRLASRLVLPLRSAAFTLVFAVPLLVFLFVVMPRVSPLWTMPLQKQQARTGMSDEMSPGDVNRLAASPELVFRAGFSAQLPEKLPAQQDLYWRGVVLDEFDGRRWKNQCDCNYRWQRTDALERFSGVASYSVIIEPHGNKWVFALAGAGIVDKTVWSNGEGIFRFQRELRDRVRYDVWQQDTSLTARELSAAERERYLALPAQGNPAARELAQQWRSGGASDQQVVQRALDNFHQSFTYTLEPPLLGENSVDDFLLVSQKGFCEYFAGAFVFLMRAAGIPARVVMGYQGGERNEQGRYVTVRQYDAHAWAEIWLPVTGWTRIDPTAAVAPERIEQGFAEMFPDSQALSNALGMQTYGRGSVLAFLRMKLEYMDYVMGRWVLGYDTTVQQSLFQQWGLQSPWRLLAWFLGILLGVFGLFLLYLQWRERHARREHPVTAAYRRLCEAYGRQDTVRQLSETPAQFARRVQQAALPEQEQFVAITRAYDNWSYQGGDAIDEAGLRWDMQRLAWRLRWYYRR